MLHQDETAHAVKSQDVLIKLHNLSQRAKVVNDKLSDLSKMMRGQDVIITMPSHKYFGRLARVGWLTIDRGMIYVYAPPYKLVQVDGGRWIPSSDTLNDAAARQFIPSEYIKLCPSKHGDQALT